VRPLVVLAEDDPDIRTIVAEALRDEGLVVVEAENGRSALEQMQVARPNVVVTDLMMPVMSGNELIAAMLRDEQLARIPVIVMTAHPESLRSPAVQLFAKPFDIARFMAAVWSLAVA
jgi:CheY-like chemotaxis protein